MNRKQLPLILFLSPWLAAIPFACQSSTPEPNPVGDAGVDGSTRSDAGHPDATPGTDSGAGGSSDAGVDGSSDAAVLADAATDSGAGDGSQFIPMPDGQPAAVFWDYATETLFISDNENNQVWTWTDSAGLAKYGTTEATPGEIDAGATLVGQIVREGDGTVVVARFGSPRGAFAALPYIQADGGNGLVPGVDPTRHHIGLTAAPGNKLYGSYFFGTPGGAMQGAVTTVDLANGESDYATGFGKIVGVLAADGKLYVSDQSAGAIYVLPLGGLPDGGVDGGFPILASLPVPDQLAAGPYGSLFTGQFQAAPDAGNTVAVRQIAADGGVSLFKTVPDVGKPSGLSYDSTHKRLFVADSSTLQNGIHIFPVP